MDTMDGMDEMDEMDTMDKISALLFGLESSFLLYSLFSNHLLSITLSLCFSIKRKPVSANSEIGSPIESLCCSLCPLCY